MKKRCLALLLTLSLLFTFAPTAMYADILEGDDVPSPNAGSYVFIDGKTGQVLFGKDYDEAVNPANLVQMMTAVLVIEEGNLNDNVTVPEIPEGAQSGNRLYLRKGEKINLSELLEGIIIYNANDAAVAAAYHIGGSTKTFVEEMNARAAELGMKDTTFTSVYGAAKNQTTTAQDMAILAAHAASLSKYVELAIQPDLNWNSEMNETTVTNANGMQDVEANAVGIKLNSKKPINLVASMTKSGRSVVGVMIDCEEETAAYTDMQTALNYALENTTTSTIVKKGATVATMNFDTDKAVRVAASKGYSVTTAATDAGNYTSSVVLDSVKLPINEGDKVGTMQIYNGEDKVAEVPLTAQNGADKGFSWSTLLIVLLLLALLAVLAFFLLFVPKQKPRKPVKKPQKPQGHHETHSAQRPHTTSDKPHARPAQPKSGQRPAASRPTSAHAPQAQKHPSSGSSTGRQGLEQRIKHKNSQSHNGGKR